MKLFIRFLLLLLFVGFYSCDKETIVGDSITENNKSFDNPVLDDDTEYRRETRMQWASFLVVKTILGNASAEEFFINTLANSPQTNIITLRSLLGKNIFNNTFKEGFKSEFLYYSNPQRLGDDDNEPDGYPIPSSKPPPLPLVDPMSYENVYVYSLLNDIEELEFELYFPNGYANIAADNQVTSSAYSLGISVENAQGYIHFDRNDTHSVNVAPGYRGNLIIIKYSD